MNTRWLWRRWPLLVVAAGCLLFLMWRGCAPRPEDTAGGEPALSSLHVRVLVAAVCGAAGVPCVEGDAAVAAPPTPAQPLPGASVRLLRNVEGSPAPVAELRSDELGEVELSLERDSYWLLVEAEGRARWSGLLELGQPEQWQTITLAPAVPLLVQVRGGDGQPLAGAQVLVHGDEALPQSALSSVQGEARFDAVGEHVESVVVSAVGHAPSTVQPSSREVRVQLSTPASVLVSVVDAAGQPVSDARVWLAGLDVWPPREQRSARDGTVVWDGLSRGTYDLRAEQASGVATTNVTLERGERRSLTLQLAPGRSVEVLVRDGGDGAPVADAEVVLVEDGLGPFPLRGRSDPQGRVRLGPLPPGGATVSARARGYMPESAVPVASQAVSVELALTRGGSISGRVLDVAGQPVAGASLEILGSDLRGQPIARVAGSELLGKRSAASAPLIPLGELGVLPGPLPKPGAAPGAALSPGAARAPWVSDSAGNFRLEELPPGKLRVLARHPDFVDTASAELSLAPAAEVRLELVLRPGARLLGTVLEEGGRPLARARIDVHARHSVQQLTTLSRDDGSFEFRAVATDVELFVARPSDRQRFVYRRSLQLQAGETRQLELSLPPERGALEVLVQDDAQQPLSGAIVSVLSLEPGAPLRRSLVTDGAGTVRVPDVVGLALSLRVQASGFGTFQSQLPAAPARVELSLQPALTVMGRVTQVRGRQGLSGATVSWMQGGERRTVRSDARGEFQFADAFPGPARLRVSHRGFAPAHLELTVPATGHAQRAFELPAIDLTEAGAISGRVVDAQGEPVRGARVGVGVVPAFLPAGADPGGFVQSAADGSYRLEDVPVGRVNVSAYSASLGRGSVSAVEVRAGETTEAVEIELLGGGAGSSGDALASVAITLGEQQGPHGVEVVIVNVAAGSEAERAGLREGDIVFSVDGWAVQGMAEARRNLGGSEASDVIIEIERDGELLSLNVRREAVRR